MQDQSKAFYDAKGLPSPELWTQFMAVQTPMMQTMMGNYIEQSKNLFVQMQDQMQQQARSMFQTFPFQPPAGDKKPQDR
jgi:polyhydroxyalkanoate synthesis regulator protein